MKNVGLMFTVGRKELAEEDPWYFEEKVLFHEPQQTAQGKEIAIEVLQTLNDEEEQ